MHRPPFPHKYTSTVTRTSHARASLEAGERPPIAGTAAPELHGDPTAWSPETLLASALGLSLFTAFDVFAAREDIAVFGWRETVTGVMDKKASGLAFTGFTIDVEITVAKADIERARAVLDRAKQYCVIAKAITPPITVTAHIWEHDHRRAHAAPA